MLDGELRVEVGAEAPAHSGRLYRFTLAVGTPADGTATMPPDEVPPDRAALAAMASKYGIEIIGPPPAP